MIQFIARLSSPGTMIRFSERANIFPSFKISKSIIFCLLLIVAGEGSVSGQIAQRGTATTGSSTTTTLTINKPTGVIAGDVMMQVMVSMTYMILENLIKREVFELNMVQKMSI